MTQWEYKEYKNESPEARSGSISGPLSIEKLNEFGKDGWELVTINGYQYIFKKPVTNL